MLQNERPWTARSRATLRPESNDPCIALFPEGDTSLSEEIVDLSKAEYASLKRAAAPSGSGILMFMANAALDKAGWPDLASASKGGLVVDFQLSDGTARTRVAFSSRERVRIEAAVKRSGSTLDAFFGNAIANLIAKAAA